MKNKQTAVDFLMEQLKFINKEAYAHLSGGRERKAYAMQKEQIKDAYKDGILIEFLKVSESKNAEQYYNETYGKE
jgi:hypothetical protein